MEVATVGLDIAKRGSAYLDNSGFRFLQVCGGSHPALHISLSARGNW
jgi:hypothetical protein